MTMRPDSPTGLYWSEDGEVACARHAPQPGDPRWSLEAWVPIDVVSGSVHGTLYEYQCQHCAPDGLAVEREAQLTEIVERLRKALGHQQRAEYHQREADRHIEFARRKQA
jgi:hypothetical protein